MSGSETAEDWCARYAVGSLSGIGLPSAYFWASVGLSFLRLTSELLGGNLLRRCWTASCARCSTGEATFPADKHPIDKAW